LHSNTAAAYAGIVPRPATIDLRQTILNPVENWKELIRNDFETVIFEKFPEVKKIKQILYDAGASFASMSGSGSSVYGIFRNEPLSVKIPANYLQFRTRIESLTF
jgi:4-diphosphocytidyl-2-C-methyl-D-erythritol kinase